MNKFIKQEIKVKFTILNNRIYLCSNNPKIKSISWLTFGPDKYLGQKKFWN